MELAVVIIGGRDRGTCNIKIEVTHNICEILKDFDIDYIIRSKFGCTGILHGVTDGDLHFSKQGHMSKKPEKLYEKTIRGLKISVWKDDLTTHKVDAVVNAANEDLNHVGGLAKDLVDAGGQIIVRESKDLIEKCGKVKTGDAVVTNAGNLPCTKIIHAVGPKWNKTNENDSSKLLAEAIQCILKRAFEFKIKTLAIPALSSGIFCFPLVLCANIIVDTINAFFKDKWEAHSYLDEIHLVNNDAKTAKAMEEACFRILGYPDKLTKAISGNISSSPTFEHVIKINCLQLMLKQGNIEDQQTDVIVNTMSSQGDLTQGMISKAILKKAGSQLQNEMQAVLGNRNVKPGSVIRTNAFNLNSFNVYHAVCTEWKEPYDCKVLRDVIKTCLEYAKDDKISSISFPAIGTGNLGFPKSEVAKVMIEEVISFAKLSRNFKLEVYFVLFPGDSSTVKAFEKEMQNAKTQLKTETHYAEAKYKDCKYFSEEVIIYSYYEMDEGERIKADKSDSVGLVIELCGEDNETLQEAQAWIKRTLLVDRHSYVINNNHIFYLGMKEQKKLQNIQATYGISLEEFLSDTEAHLEVKGHPFSVHRAFLEIERLLCFVQEEYAVKHERELLQSLVQWMYADHKSNVTDYDSEANMIIEKAFLKKEKSVEVNVRDVQHIVHFIAKNAVNSQQQNFRIKRQCYYDYSKGYLDEWNGSSPFYQKLRIQPSDDIFEEKKMMFQKEGLEILKLENICSPVLQGNFLLKKQLLRCNSLSKNGCQTLYQRVPAQFCNLVCRCGFQKTYSQPDEKKYGAGIYFSSNLRSLMQDQTRYFEQDQLIYIFEAEVLANRPYKGTPDLIVPPPFDSEGVKLHDCTVDAVKHTKTYVIFNSSQALPKYLITCKKKITHSYI
ncbi:protein mono-ADP-ribosyltransferase PARP9-like [Protopterus annectens]|uniref:protein mono-ADP-ribosyltransferase PARP9-like n=1 Tax=Protopterus annectens TaxID=7888 RepID=UPI001CFAC671|nr:protein mono-ADP-ribosyltransferase PARP9-like [Protopterus annectens]